MASRLKLHEELCTLLGSNKVYFQPPESIKIEYPCITYRRTNILNQHANNKADYLVFDRYEITYAHKDPDDDFSKKILEHFNYCSLDRYYVADNIYHDALSLYY